jgi:hypothetical protein
LAGGEQEPLGNVRKGQGMTGTVRDLVAGAEAMAKALEEMAAELVGCTENSLEEAKLEKIMDILDACTVARDELKIGA